MTEKAKSIILVVDDNQVGRILTMQMLGEACFEFREAASGAEALREAAKQPDLVLLDVNLPDISGIEVCRKLKADPATRNIPVLHLSAMFVRGSDRAAGLESGADGYLAQPVTREELIATVDSLLRHKETECELRQNSDFFETVFGSIQEGISVLAPDMTIVHVNEIMRKWYSANLPLEGKKCYQTYHDANVPCHPCPTLRCLESGKMEQDVVPGLPNSAAAWIELLSYPMRDRETSRITGVVEFVRDITARKRTENVSQARLRIVAAANVKSSEELMRTVLDEIEAQTGSSIGFYHFVLEDQETLSLQTWSTNTIKNMCTADGKGSHYPISRAGVWVDCVRERRPVIHNDFAALTHCKGLPAGHAQVIRELVVPTIRNDRIVAIFGVGNKPSDYDTTDVEIATLLGDFSWEVVTRKRAEEALRQVNTQLEVFTRHVAHDLRSPLIVMTAFSRILSEKYAEHLDDTGRGHLKRIADTAKRMDLLVKNLMDYSRVNQEELVLETVGLESIVRDALQQLDGQIAETGARITVQSPLPAVKTHAFALTQAITNLVGNALKFVAPGTAPEVRIWAEPLAAGARSETLKRGFQTAIRSNVEDNGIGIAQEDQARIFRVFERLHRGAPLIGGSGLGLAIVDKVMERLGGRAGVESETGKGSRFWIELP